MRLTILSFISLIALSCANKEADFSKYRTDLNYQKLSAKNSIYSDENDFKNKIYLENKKITSAKNDSIFGLVRIEAYCKKTETNYVSAILFGSIASTLNKSKINTNDYQTCTEQSYSNWIKLNWSCKDEESSFYKPKTLSITGLKALIRFLDSAGNQIYKTKLVINNTNFNSFDSISDPIYEKMDKIQIDWDHANLLLERDQLHRTILLPDSLCERRN